MVYIPETIKQKSEFEVGFHRMTFTAYKGCRKKLWDNNTNQFSEETVPGIRLEWTEPRTGAVFWREEKCSLHEKANLVKYAKWMGGKLFTKAVLKDETKFFTVLASLLNKDFMLNIGNNDSGTRNTLDGIMPADAPAEKAAPKNVGNIEVEALEDDTIPF